MPSTSRSFIRPSPDLPAWLGLVLSPWVHFITVTHRRLFLFLTAAFIIHLCLFWVIRIDATPMQRHHVTRPIAFLESSESLSPAHPLKTDVWDQLSDPRIFFVPQEPLLSSPSASFLTDFSSTFPTVTSSELPPLTAISDAVYLHPPLEPLEDRLQKALNPARLAFAYQVPLLHLRTQPTWQWDETLAPLLPDQLPELPTPVSSTALLPTTLRLGLSESGTVLYAVLEQSCGKPELDQQAITAARKIRFQTLSSPALEGSDLHSAPKLTWGMATLFWYATPEPQEQVEPTP